jgi:hypothetical protein
VQHIVNFRQHIGAEAELHRAVIHQVETFSRGVAASSDSLEEDDAIVDNSDGSGTHAGLRRSRRTASRASTRAEVNSSSLTPAASTARASGSEASANDSGATSSLVINCSTYCVTSCPAGRAFPQSGFCVNRKGNRQSHGRVAPNRL